MQTRGSKLIWQLCHHVIDEGEKKKSKGKTSKSSDKGWITVGYIPDEMPEILLTLIKT